MALQPVDDETIAEHVEVRKRHASHAAAAREIGIPASTLKHHLSVAAKRGMYGTSPVMPGFEIKRVSTQLGPSGELQREWVQQGIEAGPQFSPPEGHLIKGVSALIDSDGRTIQQWIKTKEDNANTLELIRAAVDELKQEIPPVSPTKCPPASNDRLLNQYTITDSHFGMLAWSEETGGDSYDLHIAEKLLLDWFSSAIAMSPDAHTAVLAQLGDFMHHDALESVTPAHRHVLDADSRLQKIIRVAIRLVRQVIAMLLQKHEHVHVIWASANHDPASSAWMREFLHALYVDEPRITIDNSPDVYYAFEWGEVGLFYHHGHKRKLENVDSVFAGKFREIFGRCSKCYGHIGHLHSDAVRESSLMRTERHRTLAPADAYASSGGWLSDRDAKVITYHRDYGEVSRITLSPLMVSKNK